MCKFFMFLGAVMMAMACAVQAQLPVQSTLTFGCLLGGLIVFLIGVVIFCDGDGDGDGPTPA